MAQDADGVTDEEIIAARAQIQETREELRDALAEELGGDPEEYEADRYFRRLDSTTERDPAESE